MDNTFDYDDGYGHEWEQAEVLADEAFCLYEKGQMKQAFDKLTLAIQKGPENAAWFFNMALTLDGMEQYEQAITCFEKALDLLEDDIEILNCLGVDYTRTAQYDLALATFERIEQLDPLFEPSYCNRIIAYTEMEQHEKAEQMFIWLSRFTVTVPYVFIILEIPFFPEGYMIGRSGAGKRLHCWIPIIRKFIFVLLRHTGSADKPDRREKNF
jgi:tetratricopeptide (TPR) repeat protein